MDKIITNNQDQQIYTNISNREIGSQNIDIKLNLLLATDEDKKFISIIKESNDIFIKYINDAQKAALENNLKSLETAGIN